jgi:hypothetical protein
VPEWLVRLDGDPDDLRLLVQQLSSTDPSVREDEEGYRLRYTGFDSLTEATGVYELARMRLGEISGVAKLLGGGTLKVEVVGLAQENKAGPRSQYAFQEGVESEARFGMSTTAFLGWLAVAERNPSIARALDFYQRGDWFNLYKAWEAVAQGVGGEHVILNQKRWTTKKHKDRFTNSFLVRLVWVTPKYVISKISPL